MGSVADCPACLQGDINGGVIDYNERTLAVQAEAHSIFDVFKSYGSDDEGSQEPEQLSPDIGTYSLIQEALANAGQEEVLVGTEEEVSKELLKLIEKLGLKKLITERPMVRDMTDELPVPIDSTIEVMF